MQRQPLFFLTLACIALVLATGCTSAPGTSSGPSLTPASPRISYADAQFISNTTLADYLPAPISGAWVNRSTQLSPSGTSPDGTMISGTKACRYFEQYPKRIDLCIEDTGMTKTDLYRGMQDYKDRKAAWENNNMHRIEIGTVKGNPSVKKFLTKDDVGSFSEFILVNDRFIVLIQGNRCADDIPAIENSINFDGLKALK